ncbi:MAG: metallophosphoesterase [Ignavibacteriaceae bacterium]|nr:metallophosphoesterase [Ignavibacteriaceae bacterium]
MAIFFIIFFVVYGSANFYLIYRGLEALTGYPVLKIIYSVVFIVAALSYIFTRFVNERLPEGLYDFLLWVGSLWFAFMLYFFLWVIFIDLLRLANYIIPFFPAFVKDNIAVTKIITFSVVLVSTCVIVFAGYLNTRKINMKTIEITAAKGSADIDSLNIVMASDFHLTPVNDGKLLKQIVEKMNSLKPDIILLPGDIVDEKGKILDRKKIGAAFEKLKPKYGIYASTGNHEYISGVKQGIEYMERHGINVLRDTSIKIDDKFYIAAREDRSKNNFSKSKRKTINEVLTGVDKNYPIILLDHTPLQLEEAMNNDITLQLSGHTHHGQMFPINLITKAIYEISWGYLKKGNTHYYVSSGVGTWGPPVRLGSRSEIVNIKIKFE